MKGDDYPLFLYGLGGSEPSSATQHVVSVKSTCCVDEINVLTLRFQRVVSCCSTDDQNCLNKVSPGLWQVSLGKKMTKTFCYMKNNV